MIVKNGQDKDILIIYINASGSEPIVGVDSGVVKRYRKNGRHHA